MVVCPSAACGSPNVESLPHYWMSLPKESPLRGRYAPPEAVEMSYWVALAAVALGIAVVVSGSSAGLLLVVGGVVWGAVIHRRLAQAEAQRAAWEQSRVCRACEGVF